LSIRGYPLSSTFDHAKKVSNPAEFMLHPLIICHFNCPVMGKKATYPFQIKIYCFLKNPRFCILWRDDPKNGIDPRDFEIEILDSIQNKYHIRNQQVKIRQKLYVSF
jgi:hypothetical protein